MSEYDLSELLKGAGMIGFSEELQEKINALVEQDARFKPAYVNITAPHAVYMEFGTGPCQTQFGASSTSSGGAGDEESELVDRIFGWAKAIHLIPNNRPKDAGAKISDKEYRNLAYAIAHKIAKEGLAPTPFIRPVLYDEKLLEEAREMIGEGKSIKDVAELYANKMIELACTRFYASKFEKPSEYKDELHIYKSISVSDKPLDNAKTDHDFSYNSYAPQVGVKK